jgi:hypothetical protein
MPFKPVAFEPYRRKRAAWRPPRWLVLLLLGVAAGAAGLIAAQQRLLPPRLSAPESAALNAKLAQAVQARDLARREQAAAVQQLAATTAARDALAAELAADRERTKNARADQDFFISALPPDPRGGVVAVRAARFNRAGGELSYEVLLTRAEAGAPLAGVMQLVVSGWVGSVERYVEWDPVPVQLGAHQSLRGSLPLPPAFVPKRVTIRVLDRVGGKQLGMRVIYVN